MNKPLIYILVIFILACILDFFLVRKWRIYKDKISIGENEETNRRLIFKQVFFDDVIKYWVNSKKTIKSAPLAVILELLMLMAWAILVGWKYLAMDPNVVPTGENISSLDEFGAVIQANHLWMQMLKCGWCATWNGFQQGGYPAFADLQGSMLHPIVIIATLLWGVVNGVKLTIVLSFWFAGFAQWWISHELRLGFLPRMWSAAIAIAGGHLAGRMELGLYGMVLSTAMTSLFLAALIRLARTASQRDAIILGIAAASAILSGQGYMQVGLLAILLVAICFFVLKQRGVFIKSWRTYITAAVTAFLLSAPLLIPLIHFSPNIVKWMDPEFKAAQSLPYLVLNLIINDPDFFRSTMFGKWPYPHLYTLYIGWIPVLFAIFALARTRNRERKYVLFLAFGCTLVFLIASALPLKMLVSVLPQLGGIRHPSLIAGLGVPLILGLSALGLEKTLSLEWIHGMKHGLARVRKYSLLFILLMLLVTSLEKSYQFSQVWIQTTRLPDVLFTTLKGLETKDLQWVTPPVGYHIYVSPAMSMGLKLSPGILPWNWKGRSAPPEPLITAAISPPYPYYTAISRVPSNIVYEVNSENQYAYLETYSGRLPCQAAGSGGSITVQCNPQDTEGVLTVQENMWTGWHAWMDGHKISLIGDERLQINVPAGNHTFVFRYLPWDVPLGLLLFFAGIFFCLISWISPKTIPIQK